MLFCSPFNSASNHILDTVLKCASRAIVQLEYWRLTSYFIFFKHSTKSIFMNFFFEISYPKIESDTNRQSLTCSTKPCERNFSIVFTNSRKTSKTVVVPSKKNSFFNSLINVLFYALILIETCVSSDSALNSASDDIL